MTTPVIRFETRYQNGKGVDYVLLGARGEAMNYTQTWHRVEKLRPRENVEDDTPTQQAMRGRWQDIEPKYLAWKEGSEIPESGMPLASWSGVTSEQAAHLRQIGYKTVEDLAAAGDAAAKFPWPGARQLPKLAKEFLESKPVADLQSENEELRERMAAMEEMLQQQEADKPRRGRPPKKEADAA